MQTKKIRVSSGVSQLDRLLGGLFIGDNVIWYDDAGSLASVFSLNFILSSLTQKKPLIYVSFDRSPKNVLETLGSLAENQYLTILDCFTHGKGDGSEVFSKFYEKDGAQWPYQIVMVNEPGNPKKIMESIYGLHKTLKGDVRFVFESLTGMQDLWEGEEHVLKFYTHSCPKLYELDTVAYWVIEKGAHSSRLKAHMNQIAQVAIDLSLKRGNSTLTILKAERRKPDALNKPNIFWADGTTVSFETDKRGRGKSELGMRIKEIRIKQGLTQKDLAGFVGVTPSTISQIESNQIFPSIPALYKIAETFSVNISSLFPEKADITGCTVFTDGGKNINFPDLPKGHIKGKLLSPVDFDAKTEPYLIEIPAKKKLLSHFFIHKGEEMGYVLSGKLQVTVRNTLHQISAGDVIYLTSDIPSQWENTGSTPAKLFWIKIS